MLHHLIFLSLTIIQVFSLLNLNLNLAPSKSQFSTFSANNIKRYLSSSESKYRETVFTKNMELINTLNNKVNSTYKQGLTFYSDFTSQEFKSLILNPRIITTPEAIKEFKNLLAELAGVTNEVFKTVTGLTGGVEKSLGLGLLTPVNGLLGGLGGGVCGLLSGLRGVGKVATVAKTVAATIIKKKETPIVNTNKTTVIYPVAATQTKNQTTPATPAISQQQFQFTPSKDIKPSVDWRSSNSVSDVKMQGACGNCYAFSATGALQSAYMIRHNLTDISYSDQQLTDCCSAKGFGCNGCDGGWQWQAFQYVKANGITTEQEYPTYSSQQGIVSQCQKITSSIKIINQTSPFKALPQGNVTALYQAVSRQPVSVGVDSANMQFASSTNPNELFTNCSSSFDDANHAMLVVGYDKQGNWILKNSWSSNWGNQGYIKLKAGNTCGIANYALYPNVI